MPPDGGETFIVKLHAPAVERTTMNESSQAYLAYLDLNRLRRWTFIVPYIRIELNMKKFLCFLLCTALFCGITPAQTSLADAEWPSDISIQADAGILMDADSGAVLYGKNIHESYFPASITKILTALIILENCDLDDTVTFSNTAVNSLEQNATILGARVGDQLSVRDCLYALLLQSANEVANALAEHCSGSIEEFAVLMNRKAEFLGCTNSHFANPSGLNNENHYTSAYDMALITKAAFDNPALVEIASTTYYDVLPGQLKQYPDGWRYYTHHKMIKKNESVYYNGIIGGKTGYTTLAGNTLVTCARRDNLKLIAVVLNGHQTHYQDTKAMFNFGFSQFKSVIIAEKDSTYEKIEDDLSIGGIFPGTMTHLSIDSDSSITLPVNGDFADVTSSLSYDLGNQAPGTAVARIDYMYGEHKVGQAYLEAAVIPGFTPGNIHTHQASPGSDAGDTIEVPGRALEPSQTPTEDAAGEEEDSGILPASSLAASVFPVLKKILLALAVVSLAAALTYGIISYRKHRREQELTLRRERRERRLRDWGYSANEFDSIMQKHLQTKNKPK